MPSAADWDLFQSLHAVLEAGTFSAAAKIRGLTQPTLGRHIETLERQLGAPLFVRSPRGIQPTELALRLRPHLEDMSSAAAAALRDAAGSADGEGGVVRVTASEVMGVEVLPGLLADFQVANPGIDVELVITNRTEDLSRREADIAVRMARPTQSALVARKVGVIGFGFYARPEYLQRRGVPQSLDDLEAHTIIGYDTRPPSVPNGIQFDRPISRDMFNYRTDNDAAQVAALKAGVGIGVCQHQIARRAGLAPLLPTAFRFELEVWVCMHENLKASRRMRLMFDHLVQSLGAYVGEVRE